MSRVQLTFDRRWIVYGVVLADVLAATILGLLLGAAHPGSWGVLLSVATGVYALAILQVSIIEDRGSETDEWLAKHTIGRLGDHQRAEIQQQQTEELARRAQSADMAVEALHDVGNFVSSIATALGELQCAVDHGLLPHVERALDLVAQGNLQAEKPSGDESAAFLSAARRKLAEEKQRLQQELRHADHLLKCIADMVSAQQLFARDTSREALEATDPASVVRAALAINAATFRRLGVRVETDLQSVGQVPLARTQLLQVVNNLLKNAAEAVAHQPAERRSICVSVSPKDEDHFQIRVADQGCGIPADQLASIFRHGYTTKLSGHGFGLSSCARLVHQFDGSLTAASEGLDRGATFTITIPRQRKAVVAEPVAVES